MKVQAAVLIAGLAMAASVYAETVSTDVTYQTFNGILEISDAAFASVSTGTIDPNNQDIAYSVQPGSTVEMTGNYTLTEQDGGNPSCPGCEVQDYLAFLQPAAVGSVGLAFTSGTGFSTAPTPFDLTMTFNPQDGGDGEYFIGEAVTLQYGFQSNVAGGPGLDGQSVSFEINNNTPEPASSLMMGTGLIVFALIARRKLAR